MLSQIFSDKTQDGGKQCWVVLYCYWKTGCFVDSLSGNSL